MGRRLKAVNMGVGISILALFLIGCPKLEKNAYNTAVAAKAFLDSVKSKHPECAQETPSNVCILLAKATSAKDALIDAGEIYCGGGAFESGGPCNAPSKKSPTYQISVDKLKAALANYVSLQADLRGAL